MDNERNHVPTWIAPAAAVAALGLLGAGIYAVFFSGNGPGTATLLVIGPLILFVVVYHDQIRSMEFGGAKIQLALKVKDGLKNAFELRLAGDYEGAVDKLEFAFDQFVSRDQYKEWEKYRTAKHYGELVRESLEDIIKGDDDMKGRIRKTASSLSFLPLIDMVMELDGPSVSKALTTPPHVRPLCQALAKHLEMQLRVGVVVRPGQDLNSDALVRKLWEEFKDGPFGITCFLLIQNCTSSKTASEFLDRAIERGMHATSLVWDPNSGLEKLKHALWDAILSVCERSRCTLSSQAPSPTEFGTVPKAT